MDSVRSVAGEISEVRHDRSKSRSHHQCQLALRHVADSIPGHLLRVQVRARGYTEDLRHEVRPFNIHVSLTEAGFLNTPIRNHRHVGMNRIGESDPWRQRALTAIRGYEAKGPGPELVAETLLEIASSSNPRLRYLIGPQARSVPRL